MFIYFAEGDEIGDGVYYNFPENDTERSWLTDILQEEEVNAHATMAEEVGYAINLNLRQKSLAHNKRVCNKNLSFF